MKQFNFSHQFEIAKLVETKMRKLPDTVGDDGSPLYTYVSGWSDDKVAEKCGIEGVNRSDVQSIRKAAGFTMPRGRAPGSKANGGGGLTVQEFTYIKKRLDELEGRLTEITERLDALEGAVLGPEKQESG